MGRRRYHPRCPRAIDIQSRNSGESALLDIRLELEDMGHEHKGPDQRH